MRKYELTVILPPSFSKKEQDGLASDVKKEVGQVGGKMGKQDLWGKKELAYPIKKNTEGIFVIFPFEAPADKIKELEAKLRLNEQLLRYLLLTG